MAGAWRYHNQLLPLVAALLLQFLEAMHLLFRVSKSQSMVSPRLFISLGKRNSVDKSWKTRFCLRMTCVTCFELHIAALMLWLLSDHFCFNVNGDNHANDGDDSHAHSTWASLTLLYAASVVYLTMISSAVALKHFVVSKLLNTCYYQIAQSQAASQMLADDIYFAIERLWLAYKYPASVELNSTHTSVTVSGASRSDTDSHQFYKRVMSATKGKQPMVDALVLPMDATAANGYLSVPDTAETSARVDETRESLTEDGSDAGAVVVSGSIDRQTATERDRYNQTLALLGPITSANDSVKQMTFCGFLGQLLIVICRHMLTYSTVFNRIHLILAMATSIAFGLTLALPLFVQKRTDSRELRYCVMSMIFANCILCVELVFSVTEALFVLRTLQRVYGFGKEDANVILLKSGTQNYLINPQMETTHQYSLTDGASVNGCECKVTSSGDHYDLDNCLLFDATDTDTPTTTTTTPSVEVKTSSSLGAAIANQSLSRPKDASTSPSLSLGVEVADARDSTYLAPGFSPSLSSAQKRESDRKALEQIAGVLLSTATSEERRKGTEKLLDGYKPASCESFSSLRTRDSILAEKRRESVIRKRKKNIKKWEGGGGGVAGDYRPEFKHQVALRCLWWFIALTLLYAVLCAYNVYVWLRFYKRRRDDGNWYESLVRSRDINVNELAMLTLYKRLDIVVFALLLTHMYASMNLFLRLRRGTDDNHPLFSHVRRAPMGIGVSATVATSGSVSLH